MLNSDFLAILLPIGPPIACICDDACYSYEVSAALTGCCSCPSMFFTPSGASSCSYTLSSWLWSFLTTSKYVPGAQIFNDFVNDFGLIFSVIVIFFSFLPKITPWKEETIDVTITLYLSYVFWRETVSWWPLANSQSLLPSSHSELGCGSAFKCRWPCGGIEHSWLVHLLCTVLFLSSQLPHSTCAPHCPLLLSYVRIPLFGLMHYTKASALNPGPQPPILFTYSV